MTPEQEENNLDFSREAKVEQESAAFYSERDPEDVMTISHLLRAVFILTALLFLSGGLNLGKPLQKVKMFHRISGNPCVY